MKVVWTAQARERLREINDFIARNSPETAARFIDRLIASGDRLSSFPEIGRPVSDIGFIGTREIVEGNYRIVYWIRSQHIEILTVFEGHRQPPQEDLS